MVAYIDNLIHQIPFHLYFVAAIILCLGVFAFIKWEGIGKGIRYSASLILAEYIVLLYCSTILYRETKDVRKYDFHPFWSYNNPGLYDENIMNVVVFVPIGLLLGASIKDLKWWYALLIGFCLSSLIEILQFVFKKGFSETDDVMHNTLGCLIGFGFYSLIELSTRLRKTE